MLFNILNLNPHSWFVSEDFHSFFLASTDKGSKDASEKDVLFTQQAKSRTGLANRLKGITFYATQFMCVDLKAADATNSDRCLNHSA